MRYFMGSGDWGRAVRAFALLLFVAPALSACGGNFVSNALINTKAKFSSAEYGVSASKRIHTGRNIPKGGGRYQVGKPYKVAGRWYKPRHDENYDNTGLASWYGPNFHGRQTANGEIFDQNALTAAHPTLPLPSYVRVTNLENNRSIMVRVNDRGPFAYGREIDLSRRSADMLGFIQKGTARVRVKYVGRAPLEGDDTRMLMASYNKPTRMERSRGNDTRIAIASIPDIAPIPAFKNLLQPRTRLGNVTVSAEGFNIVSHAAGTLFPSDDGLGPLFYAPETPGSNGNDNMINAAFSAAEAMATRSGALETWRSSMDEEARLLRLELGVFANPVNAQKIVTAFAMLGAVDEDPVSLSGRNATRLTLTQLKPGVMRKDAIELAHQLGLRDVILY